MSLGKRLMGGWSELHVAAAAGDLARVRQAVQKAPADVDKVTKDRQSALHLAAGGGFEAVVGELLDRHAKTTGQDEAGRSPLHAAALAGHTRCVAALLGPRNKEPPAERARLLALRDKGGRDALAAAVGAGQAGAVEALLAGGADGAACRDESGCGLLFLAIRCAHVHLLPLLAPACGLEQRHPQTGGTPLHFAAAEGALPAVEWLLRAGASITTRDNAGRTAGEAALAAGQHTACRTIRDATQSRAPATAAAAAGPPAAQQQQHSCHDLLMLAGQGLAGAAAPRGSGGGAGPGPSGSRPSSTSSAAAPPPPPYAGSYPPVVPAAGPVAAPGVGQGGLAAAAPAPAGGGGGRVVVVPEQLPQPTAYPSLPPGAGVYY